MSLYFKNLRTTINGQSYYAESVDISESIPIETFSALGTKGSYAFPSNKPEGSINMTFYLTTGDEVSNIEDQYGKSQFTDISVGPFSVENALLNSFSVQGDSNTIIKGSVSYNYYGQMTSGSTPSKGSVEITPAHGAASLGTFTDIGITDITSFDYAFSQSHDVQYEIGSNVPSKVIFQEASKDMTLNILASDANFSQSNLTGVNGLCQDNDGSAGFAKKSLSIALKNLCQENVASLSIAGYVKERSFGAEPGKEAMQTLKVSEKYVREVNCDE